MVKKQIIQVVNKIIGVFGARLIPSDLDIPDTLGFDAVFERLKARKVRFKTVLDVGASNGCWTEKVLAHYPHVSCILFEANRFHEQDLIRFVSKHKRCAFKLAAVADSVGEIYFDDSNPWGGLASHEQGERQLARVRSTTVDEEVAANSLEGPFLLKLDTHGFEVPIFSGARKTLDKTNVIIVETYNFDLTGNSLKFWEMCSFLEAEGFRPIDMMEPMFRPTDESFWQIDHVFIRTDRPEFKNNKYD